MMGDNALSMVAESRKPVSAFADRLPLQQPLALVLLVQVLLSLLLVVLMAASSPLNAHPDEMLHVLAGDYFRIFWLPPAVGAPEAAASYSRYGMSYVDRDEIVYWFFGKAAALGSQIGMSPPASMRALQVAAYLCLIIWVVHRSRTFFSWLAFLMLTPQVWYIFAYVNGDSFPFLLFTGLILELSTPSSALRSHLRGQAGGSGPGPLVCGVLLGLLALSKANYLVALLFLGYVVLWLQSEIDGWQRLVVPTITAAAIVLPWTLYHGWVNDFQTSARIVEHAERVAVPALRPSAAANPDSFPFVAMRAKGVPLSALFASFNWHGLSFQSFSGLYGWMTIHAPPWIYQLFALFYAALLILLVVPVLIRGPARARTLLAGVLLFGGMVVGQSVYHSWTADFQAQGRYLFPVLPMILFFWRQCVEPPVGLLLAIVGVVLGCLSGISFAGVALTRLA